METKLAEDGWRNLFLFGREALIHIGMHKTGTTSFQAYLSSNFDRLERSGIRLFKTNVVLSKKGLPVRCWSHEVPLLILRADLDFPLRFSLRSEDRMPSWSTLAFRVIMEFMTPHRVLVMSHEALSFVRSSRELRLLKAFSFLSLRKVKVFLVEREVESWSKSFRLAFQNNGILAAELDRTGNVKPDSWLLDRASLKNAYRKAFGEDSLKILSYEMLLGMDMSTIPGLAKEMQIPLNVDADSIPWLNRSSDKF